MASRPLFSLDSESHRIMKPLKHCLKICKHHVFPLWNLVVWLNLVTAPFNEPTWNIFLSCKSAGKSACLLLWAPCHGSLWRIVCIISRILHCGIRWRWGVSFKFRPPCLRGKLHCAPWRINSDDRRASLGAVEKTELFAFLGNCLCKIYLCLEKHEGNRFLFWFSLKNKLNLFFQLSKTVRFDFYLLTIMKPCFNIICCS